MDVDTFTLAGARKLAERLRNYWQAKGYEVQTRVEEVKGEKDDKFGRLYCVRSDMVNGLPRKRQEVRDAA